MIRKETLGRAGEDYRQHATFEKSGGDVLPEKKRVGDVPRITRSKNRFITLRSSDYI